MKKLIIALSVFVTLMLMNTKTSAHYSNYHITLYPKLLNEYQREIDCLALNIYREAGIEKTEGKIAVALVTMNRLKSSAFPSTICRVVNQRTAKVCQFSWVCMSKLPRIDKNIYNYSKAIAIKVFLNHNLIEDFTGGALFYHADYVNPKWKRLQVTTKIGRHIFYKPIGKI
jgi:spore germination cell wall hydrolase CwlJ-like protein